MTIGVPDLHCHSTFSLLDGLGSPDKIVLRAKELGWGAAAITEHGWLGSAPTFYKACIENGIKPIIGCEFYIVPELGIQERKGSYHLTVLALSKEGYHNLVAWSTFASQRENFYYKPRISIEAMAEIAPFPLHHNVVLSGCLGSELNQMLLKANGNGMELAEIYVDSIRSMFSNFYIEIQNHRIEKFASRGYQAYDELLETEDLIQGLLLEVASRTNTPIVVTNDSHFQDPSQRKAHLAMKASSWKSRDDAHMSKSQDRLIIDYLPSYAYWANYMRDMEKVANGVSHGSKALANVRDIVGEADIRLDPLDNFTYSVPFSGYKDPIKTIRKRCQARLDELRIKHGKRARLRFEREIEAMGDFAHYLLLMSDFIRYAKRNGILTNTRGSAGNSLVCYCLEIHEIDSIEYGLVFERFYNPSRKKLPDIDIDIEHDRFEDFMEYVKERMAELEGEGQVVQICNYGTLANRSAFRMVAESLGMPKEQQDEISKLLPQMIDSGMVDEETDVYLAMKETYPEIYDLVSGIFDSIRQVSQHACGWLIGTKERPIAEWVPLYLIASSGTLVTQYDMKSLDDMGLVKGDFLRLKTLSVVKRCLTLVGKNSLDLQQIPLDDPDTFKMLRSGRTEGVFTLQGKENRRGAMECEVSEAADVIASVAIYRPALTRPGYHNVFNNRRKGLEIPSYPCDVAEKVLGPTYGVPIFQEQILEMGYECGMDDLEVEQFLQAIKKAKGVGRGAREAFEKIKPMYMEHATEVMTEDEAEGLWELIDKFQGYGFNKGHATSYGLLAVRAAYLKCHYPQEFFTALLDVYPEKSKYIAAARSEGFRFISPDVNRSGFGFTIGERSNEIRVGLGRIKGLGPVAVRDIVAGQPFASFSDFKERVSGRSVNKNRIESLAAIGAFSSLGVKAEEEDFDTVAFKLLGFTLSKPKAFIGLKYKHTRKWNSQRHTFLGYTREVEITPQGHSLAKSFLVPDIPIKELIEKKASPWAMSKTVLLKTIDVNGVPFHLMANEDEPAKVAILEFLAKHCVGSVICLRGSIKAPFLNDGPMGFRFYNVIGSRENDPQIFHVSDKHKLAMKELMRRQESENRNTWRERAAA